MEKAFFTGLIIIFVLSLIALIIGFYLKKRINYVDNFLQGLNTLCYIWSKNHIDEENAYIWFYNKYVKDYNHYLFSFKKLEPKNWFPKDVIDKLNQN